MPSTLALISNMFKDPRQRGVVISVWVTCFSVGIAVGPVLGGVLLEWFWWGAVFLLGVPVMAVLLVAAPLLLPRPPRRRRARGPRHPRQRGRRSPRTPRPPGPAAARTRPDAFTGGLNVAAGVAGAVVAVLAVAAMVLLRQVRTGFEEDAEGGAAETSGGAPEAGVPETGSR
ncbi:hypothetical protein GCM10010349_41450 [Streptomyces flavofungini]|uniref:MFS transporter n=1 Tax=Streptomyces flavofungini TaxID=68200 RepID=A0ABS0X6Z4_9ACTN|nr:MFS transporter [Streptomyces flavofungini]GHC67958.1 hypothetical protein GCM10010349_41450 [Streptomyces flavofungini]